MNVSYPSSSTEIIGHQGSITLGAGYDNGRPERAAACFKENVDRVSDNLYDLVRLEAAGADLDRHYSAANHSLDAKEVGAPGPARTVLGMAYGITENGTLAAYFTSSGHIVSSPFPQVLKKASGVALRSRKTRKKYNGSVGGF